MEMDNELLFSLKKVMEEKKDNLFKLRLIRKASSKTEELDAFVALAYQDMIKIQKLIISLYSEKTISKEKLKEIEKICSLSKAITIMINDMLKNSLA